MHRGATIAGMGIVSAIGHDIEDFCNALKCGRSGVDLDESGIFSDQMVGLAASIKNFDFPEAIKHLDLPKPTGERALRVGRRAPRSTRTALVAAIQAYAHAQRHGLDLAPETTGLVVAADHSNRRYTYEQQQSFVNAPLYLSPRYGLHGFDGDVLGIVSHVLNLRGEAMTASGTSASGNVALIQGLRLIDQGLVKACLVVGVMSDWSPMEAQAFHALGVLGGQTWAGEAQRAYRPFDKEHAGLVYGQASAAILLASPELIKASSMDKLRLARIRAGAIRLHASASSEPDLVTEANVMRLAIEAAGCRPEEIDYINTHGSASILGDETEVNAIKMVFGQHVQRPWINATKALTGHCLCSAGVVEAIACALQIQEGFLHANPNLTDPIDDQLHWVGLKAQQTQTHKALNNSFGFGGINTCVVLDDEQIQ